MSDYGYLPMTCGVLLASIMPALFCVAWVCIP